MVDIKSLQKKILEITLYLDSFCKEHQIEYYLMGGSALGALRHNGFIPWDDDLDVFMTYDNYQKFIDCAKKYLDTAHFYLQEENTAEWPMFFTKLRMNGTTFIEENTQDSEMHQGVFIDIMCLNNVSNNQFYRFGQYISALLLTAQTIDKRGYRYNTSLKKKVAMIFARFFVRGRVKAFLLNFVRSLNNKNTDLVGHFFGKAPYRKTSFPKKWLGIMRYVDFDGEKLPVPEKAEEYLTLRFGNWRKMPDQKTLDQYPVHALFVDLEKDYTEYVKKGYDFKNNI
ncbi:MAG: LicD family protein [Paludibacteraceae bacterium]|nr:LicD family protein [Paludibacteraceae bacterium]